MTAPRGIMDDELEHADRYGYVHGTCRVHGSFWSDCGLSCPSCDEALERSARYDEESEESDEKNET